MDRRRSWRDGQATEVLQPGEGTFDFPAFAVAAQRAAVLELGCCAAFAVGADELDAALGEALAQGLAVVGAVGDDSGGAAAGSSCLAAAHADALQGAFGKGYFSGSCRGKLACERNAAAVDHHHPLRTFAAFGFTHAEPPFLAGAKLPSKNTSPH
jgi:hypothetical protein